MIYRLLAGGLVDLFDISPRRVFALARLAVQESLRRRVLAGLAVFVVILAFAIWFLDARTPDPAKLYLSFVLTATTWLVMVMMVFLTRLQPAERHQEPHDLHDRDQARSPQRDRVGTHRGLFGGGNGAVGDHGAVQLRVRRARR